MKIRCECDAVLDMPETFFDEAYDFWRRHGHFPDDVMFVCQCGSTHKTGADNQPDPEVAWLFSHSWYEIHKHCQLVST